jgi:carbon storage regulator
MLVLARKKNQNILIGGEIIVKVLRVSRDAVRLGIEAPHHVPVHRQEVFAAIEQANQAQSQNTEPKGEIQAAEAESRDRS